MRNLAVTDPQSLCTSEKQRILIYWEFDKAWYYAVVQGYSAEDKKFHIKYGDDEQEHLDLSKENFIMQSIMQRSEIVPVMEHYAPDYIPPSGSRRSARRP